MAYVKPSEYAKMIRKELKLVYPEVKFSVTTDTYSMGSAIRISYKAELESSKVRQLAEQFGYASFDGRDDSTSYIKGSKGEYDGFIFVQKDRD